MGYIQLECMEFYAYHGHFEEEQKIGNKYIVHLSLKLDLSKAAKSDNLEDTVNYFTVYELVREEMKKKSKNL